MPVSSSVAVWEFHVKPEARPAFERTYGPDGDWARLFRCSPDYRGTVLLRDRDRPSRYFTLDHWSSSEALSQFKNKHHADYAALDKQCEGLTEQETFLGEFEGRISDLMEKR